MHSVISSASRPQCSSFLLSSLCLLLVMASPWRTGAASEAEIATPTTVTVLPKTTESSVDTTTTTTLAASGIARLKAELARPEQEDKMEVGHLDIRDVDVTADHEEALADRKDEVKFASGLWLARSKRSTASANSRYLHNGSSWKRRGRVHAMMDDDDTNESSSLNHHHQQQQSDHSYHHVPVLSSIADSNEMMATELMAAGRDMAMQMMKRRPPPGGQGRMYDVPQIECPRSEDRMERFACPSPDFRGRYRCIDDRSLCDGFFDCPSREDENPDMCLFYKTTKAHLDILAEALLRWARGR